MNVNSQSSFIYLVYEMIQEVSFMTITQSFTGVASSSNIKCSFYLWEECEKQHDYFISRIKKFTNIFKKMTYNIDVHTTKKISQLLKCRRLKKNYFPIIIYN